MITRRWAGNTLSTKLGLDWFPGSEIGSEKIRAQVFIMATGVCKLQEAVGKSRQSRHLISKNISKIEKVARSHLELNEF